MIPERYIDKEEFLGLGETVIPWEYFKGIYSTDAIIFTDDPFSGIQFYYSEKHKGCFIVTTDKTQYVTKEDLKNDEWMIIGHTLSEINTNFSSIEDSNKNDPWNLLVKRYQDGETGLLEYKDIKFNAKGEYMKIYKFFDTRPHPKEKDIRGTLMRHIDFVYWDGRTIPLHKREIYVRTNSKNIELLKELLITPQLNIMKESGMMSTNMEVDIDKLKFTTVVAPSFGKMEFVEDETIEDFIVTKK